MSADAKLVAAMPLTELEVSIQELRTKLFRVRLDIQTNQSTDTAALRVLRKQIARRVHMLALQKSTATEIV
jgi:ribosomal protein L29